MVGSNGGFFCFVVGGLIAEKLWSAVSISQHMSRKDHNLNE